MAYFVYILQSLRNSKLYVGHTNNLPRRLYDHNNGWGSKFTRQNSPWKLVYSEEQPDRISATRREKFLKSTKGSFEKKRLAFSTNQNPILKQQ